MGSRPEDKNSYPSVRRGRGGKDRDPENLGKYLDLCNVLNITREQKASTGAFVQNPDAECNRGNLRVAPKNLPAGREDKASRSASLHDHLAVTLVGC